MSKILERSFKFLFKKKKNLRCRRYRILAGDPQRVGKTESTGVASKQ
jgi:hypothetical protein